MNTTEENTLTATAIVLYVSVSTVSLGLNLLAIVVLIKSKESRKQIFKCLMLCLSIGNIIANTTVILTGVYTYLNLLQKIYTQHICFVLVLISSTAHTFALMQVFFICIERFLAIRSTRNTSNWRKRHTFSYIGSFVFIATYNGIILGLYGKPESTSCKLDTLFTDNYWIYQLSMATCRLFTYIVIVVFYGIVIFRLKNKLTTVNNQDASAEISNLPNHMKHSKRSIITLGILIMLLTLVVLPSVVTNIILASNDDIYLPQFKHFTNIVSLINPIIEPVLYVLRIKEYRKALMFKFYESIQRK